MFSLVIPRLRVHLSAPRHGGLFCVFREVAGFDPFDWRAGSECPFAECEFGNAGASAGVVTNRLSGYAECVGHVLLADVGVVECFLEAVGFGEAESGPLAVGVFCGVHALSIRQSFAIF